MLDTFENDMILSAVQQLTTEVQRVEGKANQIPVNPELPVPEVEDAGKVLGVDENGEYALVEGGGNVLTLLEEKNITINLKNDTTWDSWTPSNTDADIKAADTDPIITLSYDNFDLSKEGMIATIDSYVNFEYVDNAVLQRIPFAYSKNMIMLGIPFPSVYSDIESGIYPKFIFKDFSASQIIGYYSSQGNKSMSTTSAGVYPYNTIGTFSSVGTSIILKMLKIQAKCNDSYFHTSSYQYIDSEKTNLITNIKVYKANFDQLPFLNDVKNTIDNWVLPE